MPTPPIPAADRRPSPLEHARFVAYGLVPVLVCVLVLWHPEGLGQTRQRVFQVSSSSMAPTLRPGDRAVVDLGAYVDQPPRRGDIVVFRTHPAQAAPGSGREAQPEVYVKRVIGLPGDLIEVTGNRPRLNGTLIERRLSEQPFVGATGRFRRILTERLDGVPYEVLETPWALPQDSPPLRVPEGHVFVLGDYRSSSQDSRSLGPIDQTDIVGRVIQVELDP